MVIFRNRIHPVAAQIFIPSGTELVLKLFFTCLSVLQAVVEQRRLGHVSERLGVGRSDVELRCFVVAERFSPPEGAKAPFVARLEAGEAPLRLGRAEVVTARAGKVEKLLRHLGANDVRAVVVSVGLAVSIPAPSGQGIGAAKLQGGALDVGVLPNQVSLVVGVHVTRQQNGCRRHQQN